jgi:RNA polymerase sigma-70 factor (ECF subfamily)
MVNSPASAVAPAVPGLEEFHDAYRDRVYRVILRVVGDPSDAEDLTQETFLKVERSASQVRRPERVASWLYRVATNVALDHLRRSRRKDSTDALDPGSEHGGTTLLDEKIPSPASSLDTAESGNCVREYAGRLSDQYRVVLVLHDLEGLPMQQVADIMGSSVGATRVRLHRARKRFAEICEIECEQFYNDDGVLSCQPKSLISVQVAPSPCCEPGSSDCCPA